MNVAIFGTKREAKYLSKEIIKGNLANIIVYIDNDVNKQNTKIGETNVVSLSEYKNRYSEQTDLVILAIRGSYSRIAVLNQLANNGIHNVAVFKFSYSDYERNIDELEKAIFNLEYLDKTFMPYLEYNVVDSCNLKCKGCTHFSNLCKDDEYADVDEFKADLIQMAKNVEIGQLRLLGGEPFLHRRLGDFLDIARNVLPDADINIVTNGLLLTRLDDQIYKKINDNKIGIHISRYKPTDKMLDKIEEVLNEKKVDYFVEDMVIEKFAKCLDMRGISNPDNSQKACIALGCRFLNHGRLYKCPFDGLIDIFANYYEYQSVPQNRGIDIYEKDIDWKVLLEQLYQNPIEMCKYCAETKEMFNWQVETRPDKSDWIVSNN